MKNFGDKEAWAYPGTVQFFRVPPIISGTGKATDFTFGQYCSTFRGSMRKKAHEKFWRKGSVGVSRVRDCPRFLGTPYYLRNGKSYGFQIWPVHSEGPSEQKPIKNFGKSSRGRSRRLPKIFRALIHMAHRTVIFAIAQLSC